MAALPYAELISALDELPAFAIVNAENAPLEFEDEETGRKVSLFFVDVATARAQCARFAAQFPSLGLRLGVAQQGGGRGQTWDWSEAEDLIAHGYDVIVAGGLTPDNVAQALAAVGDIPPWGVDVATGVEDENRRKDPAKMRAFVEAVREREEAVEAAKESGD